MITLRSQEYLQDNPQHAGDYVTAAKTLGKLPGVDPKVSDDEPLPDQHL